MRGKLNYVPEIVAVLGILAMIGGWQLSLLPLLYLGLMIVGLGMVGMGVKSIIARRVDLSDSDVGYGAHTTYLGCTAMLWGISLATAGLALLAVGIVLMLGFGEALLVFVKARPGFLLAALGVFLSAEGATQVLGSREQARGFWSILGSVPGRLGGVLLTLTGLVMLGLGAFEIVAPAGFDALIERVLGPWTAYPFD
ncbi:MAG: hypothetical protein JXB35_04840 [Anaerolineae bacterium]|nr:hypothetical protein [Anaerolineae bacterium]